MLGVVATVLLPVLLAGLLVAAADLHRPHISPSATPSPAGLAHVSQERPQAPPPPPEPTPVPWPDDAWFLAPVASNGDLPTLAPHAKALILVDLGTRQTLYQRNALAALPTASLAKLMTVEVALRHVSLTTVLTVPASATHFSVDDTTMGLTAGEKLTVAQLIDGIFLESANDAATVLAQAIIPEPTFIAEMNDMAEFWGLSAAGFTNPTGLDDPGEHASAYDLAVIAANLLQEHPELLGISDQKHIVIPQTATHQGYDLWSLIGPVLRGFPGADGLKTGYTDNAGYCLALTDHRGGRTLLAIVLNSSTDIDDAQALIDFGFKIDPP